MKVLFLTSSRKGKGLSPFISSQRESLEKYIGEIDVLQVMGSGFFSYVKSIRLLRKRCKKMHYDIIHAHYGFCGMLALLSLPGKPIIVSFMGDDLLGTSDAKGKNTLISILITKINILISPLYSNIIVKTRELGSTLRNTPYHIIPNGVNFEHFYPCDKQTARGKLGLKNNEVVVVFASSANIPNKNFKLAKEAINTINDIKINLLTLENIQHKDVFLFLNAADLMLLLSFHEGSPNVIKEAMACNCPIVATDVGDIREIISNTEGCYICSFNITDVASKIRSAIKFGKRTCGREAIKHLESEVIAQQIIKVYKRIL